MNRIELHMMYKNDTGSYPVDEKKEEIEFDVFRSKGQWILNMSDEEVISLRERLSEFVIPDSDYVEWLENKLMECYGNK